MYYNYQESLVTREFRDLVVSKFPIDTRNRSLHRLLDYLLSGDMFDKETDLLMLPHLLCDSMRDKIRKDGKSNSFTTKGFVEKFKKKFFDVEILPSIANRRVTLVQSVSFPHWLEEGWEKVVRASREERSVLFVSGDEVDLSQRRSRRLGDASSFIGRSKHQTVTAIVGYLNGLDESHFSPILAYWDEAYRTALRLEGERSRKHQLAMLNRIKTDPQPFYRPAKTSSRIYATGSSFLGLKSCVRDVFTRGWAKLDLNQAQLNIVSNLWSVPEVHDYVSNTAKGFWVDLATFIEVDPVSAKPLLKEATYSLLYGASKKTIQRNLSEGMEESKAKRFFEHGVFKLLDKARDVRRSAICFATKGVDAFGNDMVLEGWKEKGSKHDLAMSILSCQAQSYEVAILKPVIDYAKSTEGTESPLFVTGWLHDGIWLHCEDQARLSCHLRNVEQAVQDSSEAALGFRLDSEIDMPSAVDVDK